MPLICARKNFRGSGNIRGKYSVEREPQDKKLFCRWGELAFALGTFFIALGVSLMEKGGLGMSMVTSQSYIISLAVPFLTFGMADYMLQGLLLIGYYIIVRRFDWKNILSFFSAFIFGVVLDGCRFVGCSHTKEKGCAVLEAVRAGKLSASRHASYLRLYNELKDLREWSSK